MVFFDFFLRFSSYFLFFLLSLRFFDFQTFFESQTSSRRVSTVFRRVFSDIATLCACFTLLRRFFAFRFPFTAKHFDSLTNTF